MITAGNLRAPLLDDRGPERAGHRGRADPQRRPGRWDRRRAALRHGSRQCRGCRRGSADDPAARLAPPGTAGHGRRPGWRCPAQRADLRPDGPLRAALPAVYMVAFTIGTIRDRARSATGLALCAAAVVAEGLYDPQIEAQGLPFVLVLLVAFFTAGCLVGARTRTAEALRQRSAELRDQREHTARLAVLADRAKMSADLRMPCTPGSAASPPPRPPGSARSRGRTTGLPRPPATPRPGRPWPRSSTTAGPCSGTSGRSSVPCANGRPASHSPHWPACPGCSPGPPPPTPASPWRGTRARSRPGWSCPATGSWNTYCKHWQTRRARRSTCAALQPGCPGTARLWAARTQCRHAGRAGSRAGTRPPARRHRTIAGRPAECATPRPGFPSSAPMPDLGGLPERLLTSWRGMCWLPCSLLPGRLATWAWRRRAGTRSGRRCRSCSRSSPRPPSGAGGRCPPRRWPAPCCWRPRRWGGGHAQRHAWHSVAERAFPAQLHPGTETGVAAGLAGTVCWRSRADRGRRLQPGRRNDHLRSLAVRVGRGLPPPAGRATPGPQRRAAGRAGDVRRGVRPLRAGADRPGPARRRRALPQRDGRPGQRRPADLRPRRSRRGARIGRGGGGAGPDGDRPAGRAAGRRAAVRRVPRAAHGRRAGPPGQRHGPRPWTAPSWATATSSGPPRPQTAYRVVQEALTNAFKHAPGAPVDITVQGKTPA